MLPEHAPYPIDQRRTLDSLIASFSPAQCAWLSGFLAGSAAQSSGASAPAKIPSQKLTVLYGTESGNSETLASRAAKEAKSKGFQTTLKSMADVTPADLASVSNLLVIVSTWGDGDPPESAATFHKAILSSSQSLPHLKFSVCALGDTAYEKFCQTGKDLDARLEAIGATRIADRRDCDVDYEEPFSSWLANALAALTPASAPSAEPVPQLVTSQATEYGKKNLFPAEILESVSLSTSQSNKEILHLEFSLAGSGMTYEPGDVLAVLPVNCPEMVQSILTAAKLTGSEEIETKSSGKKSLADALRSDFDITSLSRNFLTKLHEVTHHVALAPLLAEESKEVLKAYLCGREIIDALIDFAPEGLDAQSLANLLRKLPPRLYSIASSPLAHPDEVHLTVAAVRYHTHGRDRKGVCSTYLADFVKPGDPVPVFIQPNKNFRLPADCSVPIIMVGPGTGIAPFRAFVEHRTAIAAKGKSWLILGGQHYLHDFLYQLEWQDHLKHGALTRLDVAFSRDQPEKFYVQHRLQERAAEIYAWLENGAHFYVCGDARHMAADVHETLISIVSTHGNQSREDAEAYVEQLKKSHRYQRDVY